MTIYDRHCNVKTPYGMGRIVDIDTMSNPVIIYTVNCDNFERKLFAPQVKLLINPKILKTKGRLIASDLITAVCCTHYIFTYEYDGQIWFYHFSVDDGGLKKIHRLESWAVE